MYNTNLNGIKIFVKHKCDESVLLHPLDGMPAFILLQHEDFGVEMRILIQKERTNLIPSHS